MHIKLHDNIKTFEKNMSNGAIYFEFTDGYRFSLHRSLYITDSVHRKFVDGLISDYKVRSLVKMYYKVQNLVDSTADNQSIWVDLIKIQNLTNTDIYQYAFNYRNIETLQVDIKNIKSTDYTDESESVFYIDSFDGTTFDEDLNHIIKINTRDKRYTDIMKFNIDEPLNMKDYLKDDIKILLKDDNTTDNTLVWMNGRFVETSKADNSNKIMYISKGVSSLSYVHKGFIGDDPLSWKHIDIGHPVASYDPEESRYYYGPDFDINIFKWKDIIISDWFKPNVYDYEAFNYSKTTNGNVFNMVIDHINSITFPTAIEESHIILHNGIILERDKYTIENNTIYLKGIREKVSSIIASVIEEYPLFSGLPYIVEAELPKGEDYRLINFTHSNSSKVLKLNRSSLCLKNSPYPFHITFPEVNVGDIILLDGVFERYLLYDKNIINYPYTTYMARYGNKNLLSGTKVERLWFTNV